MPDLAPLTDELPIDGRRARRHRSRDLAVDALLDLLNEGVLRPTAQQVAERSGVSLRSIFRIFDDVQSLHEAATTRHIGRVIHLFVPIEATGTTDERLWTCLDTLRRLYEAVAPIRRAGLRMAPESPAIQEQVVRARAWLRGEIERLFGAEIAGTPDAAATASALETLLSFEAWDQMRTSQALSPERTAEVLHRAARTLLA